MGMHEFIQNFLINLSKHQYYLYPLLFIVSFAESFAFIGLFVPGAVFIVTAGFLSTKQILDINRIIVWTTTGAVLADIASFYIAKKFGNKIYNSKIINKFNDYYIQGKIFFKKYGGISVLIGRFIGPIRPIIPFLAGLLGMDTTKFWIYAIISGILWGIGYSLTGYFFGETWKLLEIYNRKLSILLLFLLVFLFCTRRLYLKLIKK